MRNKLTNLVFFYKIYVHQAIPIPPYKVESSLLGLCEYKNEVYVEGLETRYTDMCLFRDLDNLTDKVHNKVMEKLADKIADDVVDRILSQIAENKKEKEKKNSF